ncbi:AMP-binding protein [Natronorubrum tibetense]|uniref:AMP-dependent synthetase and ligase n=1 Tax=Natronorubrum tibetense GA33 TaxID=1114856 RepID=L9VLC0_9EURY|nr:AMP-binding protein [Natronorubrum tibetense]ELY37767.1 AMP-dependent synthetase and ligase [Natronorubrum tibetense GA33]
MIDSDILTAHGLLHQACTKYASRSLATVGGETMTYGEAWNRGGKLARVLSERGLEKGDFVGIMMSNRLDYFTANFACVRGGFVNVPMNDMLTRDEFSYMLADSGARGVVVGPDFTDTIEELRSDLPDLETVIAVDESPPDGQLPLDTALNEAGDVALNVSIDPGDLLRLSYTGGTTGRPKGARHTHRLIAMDMLAHVIAFEIRDGESMLISTPLPHAAGYIHLGALTQGAHLTVTPGFDPGEFLALLDDEPITWTFLVPTMIYRMLDHDAVADANVSTLDTLVYGAAPISEERLTEAIAAFGDVFIQAYGQTEMPNVGMVLPKVDHEPGADCVQSCGRPATMVDAEIAEVEHGRIESILDRGGVGELIMRSPYVMDGYHDKPEQTAETLVDGWLLTGDIARMDEEGYVYLLDRANDVIVSGGMNVYTTEVEDALERHPDLNLVAVIGVPHDDWGEAVHAVVETESDNIDSSDILAFADTHLANYKKPKSVEFRDKIPTTPYGKVDKKVLREPHWENVDRNIH